jgi:16S rRNA (guanine966-N2)-methyltransferase
MADRMKESLFSALGDLEGLNVLDLYAGSGSLGLEALSRGAKKATFVESARDAILKLEQNIETCDFGDRADLIWSDVQSALGRPAGERVDLIFVDPPYSVPVDAVQRDLESLVMGGFLGDEGRVVVHRQVKESRLRPLGLDLIWERSYGQSNIYVFAHKEEG